MKNVLKYLGRFAGLRVWQGSVFNGKVYVIEILSEFVFRTDLLCDYAVLELENLTCKRGSRLVSIRTETLIDKGWTLDALMEHLKTTESHWFPDFPEACRNCKCLHIRKDGFVGCTCSRHVNWDCDFGIDSKFRDCREVHGTPDCDPEAISQWDVFYSEKSRRDSIEREERARKNADSEKKHKEAMGKLLAFRDKYTDHDLNRITMGVFAGRSTHCDGVAVRVDEDRLEIGYDCGWLNRGVTMDSLIKETIDELAKDGIVVKANPIEWYSWNYEMPGSHGSNHAYVWFIVVSF